MYDYFVCVFFQEEDGIRDLVRSRGLGEVYERQCFHVAEDIGDGQWRHEVLDFFFQAEDGIRDLVRSRGLGDGIRDRVHSVDPFHRVS